MEIVYRRHVHCQNQLDGCIVWNDTIQYWTRSGRLSVHKPLFLYSTMPSVMCLRLIDVSVICRATYFQFPIQSAFFHIGCQAARRRIGLRNMRHRTLPKIWVGTFMYGTSAEENDIKVILTVKMLTRYPVAGSFGSEFPAICNHCVVSGLNSQDVDFVSKFCVFLKKTLRYNFQNSFP